MSDFEQRIAAWRTKLLTAVGGNADIVAELEAHLRDAVHEQTARGVPAEQALTLALARLGDPEALAAEFAKSLAGQPWLILAAIALFLASFGWPGSSWPARTSTIFWKPAVAAERVCASARASWRDS